jgi:hypothetical protein
VQRAGSEISDDQGIKNMHKHGIRCTGNFRNSEEEHGPPLLCLDAKGVFEMMNTALTGMRCRATKEIRGHQGLIRRFTEGTILYDLANLGRHLISVDWDNGLTDYAYPFEIEIINDEYPLIGLEVTPI